jgi:hypothetical protein
MVIKSLYANIAVFTVLGFSVSQQPTGMAKSVQLPHLISYFPARKSDTWL